MAQTILYRQTVPTRTSALREIRQAVEREALGAGFASETAFQIALAVDEACTNVIEHSYHDLPPDTFTLEIGQESGRFIVTLTDAGRPFNGPLPSRLDLAELVAAGSSGGLGLHIIARVMDSAAYTTGESRMNVLRLVKRID